MHAHKEVCKEHLNTRQFTLGIHEFWVPNIKNQQGALFANRKGAMGPKRWPQGVFLGLL